MTDIDGLIAGLLSPEYGIADMPLIREAADALAAQQREIEELKHDLSRYMDIANEHVNAAADAEKELELVRAERQRAQQACEQIGERLAAAEKEIVELLKGLEEILEQCGQFTDPEVILDWVSQIARSLLQIHDYARFEKAKP